jgi:hypothetical protein
LKQRDLREGDTGNGLQAKTENQRSLQQKLKILTVLHWIHPSLWLGSWEEMVGGFPFGGGKVLEAGEVGSKVGKEEEE